MAELQRKKDDSPIIARPASTPSAASPVSRQVSSSSASSSSSVAAPVPPTSSASVIRASSSGDVATSSLASDVGTMRLSEVPMSMVRSSAPELFYNERVTRSVGPVVAAPAPSQRGSLATAGPLMGMAPTGAPFVHGMSSAHSPLAVASMQARYGATVPVGAKTATTAPPMMAAALPGRVLYSPVMSAGPSLLSSSKSKSSTRLERPACVPGAPFFLTAFVLHLASKVSLGALRGVIERALRDQSIDFEYNEAKWKAKCYMYRACGNCSFVLRLYTNAPAQPSAASTAGPLALGTGKGPSTIPGPLIPSASSTLSPSSSTSTASSGSAVISVPLGTGDSFLIELQRRKGCGHLFRRTYDRLVAHFARSGLLPPECPAASRARAMGLLTAGPEAPLSSPSTGTGAPLATGKEAASVASPASDPCASTARPPFSVLQDRTDAVDPIGAGSHSYADADDNEEGAETDATGANGPTVRDPRGVVDAFTSLSGLITSEYDDIAAPAAQALAGLCASRKLRSMAGEMGMLLHQYHLQLQRQQQQAATAGTPSTPSTTAAAASLPALSPQQQADGQAMHTVLTTLAARSMHPHASLECRTSCIIALNSLAKDAHCAEIIAFYGVPSRLLMIAMQTPLSAPSAALRREMVRCVLNTYTAAPKCIKAGLLEPNCCHLRNKALMQPAFAGVDAHFDALVARLDTLLMTAAAQEAAMATAASSPVTATGGSSPAAGGVVVVKATATSPALVVASPPVAAVAQAGSASTTGGAATNTSVPPPQPGAFIGKPSSS